MNVIMSLWTKPCTDGKSHGFNNVQEMMESLVVSSNVAKKHYNEIHFYTDKLGMKWIEPYLKYLPFTKIEVCLDELNWLDDKYWSLSKMYVYNKQEQPFIHIDNDVFLWEKFPDGLFDNDFFFQEIEYFNELGRDFYIRGLNVYKDALPKNFIETDGAFNCGVFGCLTEKSLKLIPQYYEMGVNFVENTKNLKDLDKESISSRWLATVIIEQVIIYSLVTNGDYKFEVFLHHGDNYSGFLNHYNFKYTHTVAHHKRNPKIVRRIREIFEEDVKKGKEIKL
jgi:hypothetical protein